MHNDIPAAESWQDRRPLPGAVDLALAQTAQWAHLVVTIDVFY
jgi:hypothetical protein